MYQKYSSSQTSKSSNFSRSRTATNPSSLMRKMPANANETDADLALETYINSLQLQTFSQLTEEEQEDKLSKIDALELFQALQLINQHLAMARLENHFLKDFLEKNDQKLLIGLEQRRATAESAQLNVNNFGKDIISIGGGSSYGGYNRPRATSSRSIRTTLSLNTLGSQKKPPYDYKLNFRAKTEMAEKTANEVEKRVQEIERNASNEIKLLRGHLEEMHFMLLETQETAKNFELHFLHDENDIAFLNSATEKQIDRKLKKFVNNWIKNARALLGTMRLKISSLQEHCQQLRNELLTKSDLSGILTAIDFKKLIIKREELLKSLKEKNINMSGLKGVTGKASLSMAEEKQIMMNIEEESKQLNDKTIDVVNGIAKLEKEIQIVELENEKDILCLNKLKEQLEHFEAPSVKEYIDKKDQVLALEKEEKMLRRKIYILNMKLENTQKKCKRMKPESNIFINQIEE